MLPFKSVQKSWLHFILIPLMLILILFAQHFNYLVLTILGILTILLFLVHSLIVEVNTNMIRIKFGPGFIQKKLKIKDIQNCEPVINEPWYRFGLIRFGRDFTLYNVSGRQAVELTLANRKKKIRIGTDEPDQVCEAIHQAIKKNQKE